MLDQMHFCLLLRSHVMRLLHVLFFCMFLRSCVDAFVLVSAFTDCMFARSVISTLSITHHTCGQNHGFLFIFNWCYVCFARMRRAGKQGVVLSAKSWWSAHLSGANGRGQLGECLRLHVTQNCLQADHVAVALDSLDFFASVSFLLLDAIGLPSIVPLHVLSFFGLCLLCLCFWCPFVGPLAGRPPQQQKMSQVI